MPDSLSTGEPNQAPAASMSEDADRISAVSVKVPPFWKESPEQWFSLLESRFALSGITVDSTKFHHTVSALDEQLIKIVGDVVTNPPTTDKFAALKRCLINRLSTSETSKVFQLLGDTQMGDRQPSQFLRELRGLAGNKVTDDFLKILWLRRLPENIQMVLACNPGNLEQLAEYADKMAEVMTPPTVYAATNPFVEDNKRSQLEDKVDKLTLQLQKLTTAFNKFEARPRSRSRDSRPYNHNATTPTDTRLWCWYHRKFRTQATKCIQPCAFVNKKPEFPEN